MLDLANDNTKEIKQDKIEPYKHHSPQKMGYNVFGGKVGPKSSQVLFCKEEYIKLARNHNILLPTNLILVTRKQYCRQSSAQKNTFGPKMYQNAIFFKNGQ